MNNQYNVGGRPPAMAALQQYNVNRPDQVESIFAPLYDTQTYAQAGQTSLTFFQAPIGQSGKTLADTNMLAAGQLPKPQEFLCVGIQIWMLAPSAIGRQAAAVTGLATNWNDARLALENAGNFLQFQIGSKFYVQDSPLSKFPPMFGLTGAAAVSIFGVAAQANYIDYARSQGRYYAITPLKIPANQNFSVTLNWTAAQAITAATRVMVILDGYLYRLSQ